MKNKKILIIFAIVILALLTATFLSKSGSKEANPTNDSSGLVVGKNAIYVADQVPGKSVKVSFASLEVPGFIVIHEDASGAPGKILGESALLPAGENKNLPSIPLSRMTKDNETFYAMLHLDNGDGQFDATEDKPAQDKLDGAPVMMIFTVDADAEEPGAVNL